jgi:DNA-binding transcriptional regulator GbsR (MarR family)
MKKIPVNVRVLRAVGAMMPKGAKVKDIVKITGMKNQNVSACLWKLKDQGKVNQDDGFYKVNDSALTPVNKEVEANASVHAQAATLEPNDESKTLTLGKVARKLAQENERLRQEVRNVEKSWREARQSSLEFERKYFDALAVISYLESK